MKMVLFSKAFKDKSPAELVAIARRCGVDGYDICIRDGHQVTPQKVGAELKTLTRFFSDNQLEIPLASSDTGLVNPEDPHVRPILEALAECGIASFKIGYYIHNPGSDRYVETFDQARRSIAGWQRLSREYGVRICLHTHCGPCLGLNAAALEGLLRGFDPECVGAFIDPAHLVVNGEDFDLALDMLEPHLALVALKDVLLKREAKNGHGSVALEWVPAGQGMVDWTLVSAELERRAFNGVYSVHCEFEAPPGTWDDAVVAECAFFREKVANHFDEKGQS